MKDAYTTEIKKDTNSPVIDILPEQKVNIKKKNFGATMRLGAYACRLKKGSKSYQNYKKTNISERHRHRYELNNNYRKQLENKGMIMAGINLKRDLVEIIELKKHPYFVGVQFHPEFKSRPLSPHPVFNGLIKAAINS